LSAPDILVRVQLTVLGSAGGYPMPGVPASGYVIEHGGARVWCDVGPGTLMGFPHELHTIDAVVISHEHADHCLDLIALFHALAYPLAPVRGLRVFAPLETIDKVVAFVSPNQTDLLTRTFDFHEIGEGSMAEVGGIRITFAETTHPVHTVASRFEADGRVLAYTGDTGPEGRWHRVADGADVFLCEATFVGTRTEHPYPYHLNAGEAGAVARGRGVGRLVVTHVPVHWDRERSRAEAAETFGAPVTIARPGLTVEV
jgi:ribonuclease BN (tRNA processing enzyme)